jgi:hypothetical protein
MECCPTCQRPLDHEAERLEALVKALGPPDGLTYREVAFWFGRSIKRIQNLVYEHGLEVRYRRIGSHPRRHVFLPPTTVHELRRLLPPPWSRLAHTDH